MEQYLWSAVRKEILSTYTSVLRKKSFQKQRQNKDFFFPDKQKMERNYSKQIYTIRNVKGTFSVFNPTTSIITKYVIRL